MTTFVKNHFTLILILFLIPVLVLAWLFPSLGSTPGMIFLLFSLFIVAFLAFEEHKELYGQGKTTRSVFIWNTIAEVFVASSAIILASLLCRNIAEIATQQFSDALPKFLAGIAIGLLVGSVVGIFASRMWGRLLKI